MNLCVFLPLFIFSTKNMWGIRVKKSIIYSFAFISIPFIVWDIIVTKLGHWAFSSTYTLGVEFFGIPLEEVMFFFTVPFACVYVWEALKRYKEDKRVIHKSAAWTTVALLVLYSTFLIVAGGGYSRIAGALLIVTTFALYESGLLQRRQFWRFQAALYCLFIGFNLILTALPVVTYGPEAITGFRFITIPIEDFAYNFVLINGSLLVYEHFRSKS